MDKELRRVCEAFCIQGTYQSYEEIKVGNVNRTYRVNYLREDGKIKSYIVQAVNTFAFKKPTEVMENIDKVTQHIHEKDPSKIALHFHHTKDRKTYFWDKDGFWRLFNYITSSTYNYCDDLQIIQNAGEAFGEFQRMLSDFEVGLLHETIPNFHNIKRRYAQLEQDYRQDPCGKACEVQAEMTWLLSVKEKSCTLTDMLEKELIPLRVTHNDTKINNVLFEKNGCKPLVIVDLDTVMPGLLAHDFGDAIRFAGNFVEEDSKDADKARLDMDIFEAFTKGFLKATAPSLTVSEINTLALSPFVLAVELSIRFLNDYLLGSPYFKVDYPMHNLVRARCQIALAKDMLCKMDRMEQIIQTCVGNTQR